MILINYHFSLSFLNATNTQFKKIDDLILILIETGKQLLIYIKKKKELELWHAFFHIFFNEFCNNLDIFIETEKVIKTLHFFYIRGLGGHDIFRLYKFPRY